MLAIDSLVVAETTIIYETNAYVQSPRISKQSHFPNEEVLAENNRGNIYQTQTYSFNGNSDPLHIDLSQRLLTIPPSATTTEFFRTIQKWQGYVNEVGEETFNATLVPLTGEGPELLSDIYIQEISPDDRALIEPGAVFYWNIGYLDRPQGRLRASIIRFRRLPVWTSQELEAAASEAVKLEELINKEDAAVVNLAISSERIKSIVERYTKVQNQETFDSEKY